MNPGTGVDEPAAHSASSGSGAAHVRAARVRVDPAAGRGAPAVSLPVQEPVR